MGSTMSWISESLDQELNSYSLILVAVVVGLYMLIQSLKKEEEPSAPPGPTYTPAEKKDMTVAELLEYDGRDPDKAILLAVCGNIYDVTRGKSFYGPGGPYAVLAGHDATRGLATMSAEPDAVKNVDDDLSDLSPGQLSQAREWDQTFSYKYEFIGKLLKAGEVKKSDEKVDSEDDAVKDGAESD